MKYFGVDNEQKLGSKEMTDCGVDECTELSEDEWSKLISLCRLPKKSGKENQIFRVL